MVILCAGAIVHRCKNLDFSACCADKFVFGAEALFSEL